MIKIYYYFIIKDNNSYFLLTLNIFLGKFSMNSFCKTFIGWYFTIWYHLKYMQNSLKYKKH